MNRIFVQALFVLAATGLAACSGNAVNQPFVPGASLTQSGAVPGELAGPAGGDIPFRSADPVHALCPQIETADQMQCFAMIRTDVVPQAEPEAKIEPTAERCPFESGSGYCPIDLQQAYKLPSVSKGKGQTIAIVDAYGYPHAASDLAYFRKTMGLIACGKCLRIVNQNGQSSPLPGKNTNWDGEQSADLDMASGICPNCKLILVQANNNDTSNLYTGVKTAEHLHANIISVSWGGTEGSENPIFHPLGIMITAAAGDNGGGGRYGGGPIQPCTYTYVVCVGGTHLVKAGNKRGWAETVWNDWTYDACGNGSQPCGATGSGCSTKIAKPSWQTDTGCRMRSAADTSATASLRAPVIVYNTELEQCSPSQCFFDFGGTSIATPIIAGVYALAENGHNQNGATKIWKFHKGNINDVIQGNNLDPKLGVTCASTVKYICYARVGFDGPTGWGTPSGLGAF